LSIGNCCRTDPDDRLHSDRPGQFFFPTLTLFQVLNLWIR
jgi:hypothetical protein